MKLLGRYLTIMIGAGPASYLSLLAGLGVFVGFWAFLEGEIVGLALAAWGGAGIYGTLSLWAIGFGFIRPWAVVGLIVGTIALTPLAGMAVSAFWYSSPEALLETFVYTGPIIVAVTWLGVLTARSFRLPRTSSTEGAAHT